MSSLLLPTQMMGLPDHRDLAAEAGGPVPALSPGTVFFKLIP
jgi:hypothetical protein